MEEIKELPDIKINLDEYFEYYEELLDYVCEVANWLLPNIWQPNFPDSKAPAIFAYRYCDSKLTTDEERYELYKFSYCEQCTFEEYQKRHCKDRRLKTDFKEKYLSNEDLQNTIEAFGLDVSKFWYLLLFVHDYIEDIGTNAPKIGRTVREDILDFNAKLSEATEIILKKDNRKSYSTNCEKTIDFIRDFIEYSVYVEQEYPQVFPQGPISNSHEFHGYYMDMSYKKVKFTEIFLHFLEKRKAKNLPHKKVKVSKDKLMFISRLLYTVDYGNIRYNEEFDENMNPNRMLSNLLRKYKNQKFPRVMPNWYQFV